MSAHRLLPSAEDDESTSWRGRLPGMVGVFIVCSAVLISLGLFYLFSTTGFQRPNDSGLGETVKEANAPVSMYVPSINAESNLLITGMDDANRLEVPPIEFPMIASWWNGSVVPGNVGPAVILGHVNGGGNPGIFSQLHTIDDGEVIEIVLDNGTIVYFTVYKKVQVDKDEFPTNEVYGDTTEPEIRLITCGGVFDRSASSYEDNVIVFGRLST